MKKVFQLALLLGAMVFYHSCTSDSDDMEDIAPVAVTYTNSVKNIISGNCTSCHGNPPSNGAPNSMTTYDEVKNAVQSRNLIGRIENGSMPPTGTLSTSQIQAIKNWQAGGFLE